MVTLLFLAIIHDDEYRELLVECYDLYRHPMFHVAYAILSDPDLAEDAVQEAFCRFAKSIKYVRPVPKHIRSFLAAVVKNAAVDILKKQNVVPILSLDAMVYEPADPVNVEDLAIQHDEMNEAEQLVLSLPIIYSTVFLLRYKHDFSSGDIARLLEISGSTARKRLQRAEEKVAELVQERGAGHNAP